MLHSIKINSPSINIVVYVPRLIRVLLCTREHGRVCTPGQSHAAPARKRSGGPITGRWCSPRRPDSRSEEGESVGKLGPPLWVTAVLRAPDNTVFKVWQKYFP